MPLLGPYSPSKWVIFIVFDSESLISVHSPTPPQFFCYCIARGVKIGMPFVTSIIFFHVMKYFLCLQPVSIQLIQHIARLSNHFRLISGSIRHLARLLRTRFWGKHVQNVVLFIWFICWSSTLFFYAVMTHFSCRFLVHNQIRIYYQILNITTFGTWSQYYSFCIYYYFFLITEFTFVFVYN